MPVAFALGSHPADGIAAACTWTGAGGMATIDILRGTAYGGRHAQLHNARSLRLVAMARRGDERPYARIRSENSAVSATTRAIWRRFLRMERLLFNGVYLDLRMLVQRRIGHWDIIKTARNVGRLVRPETGRVGTWPGWWR